MEIGIIEGAITLIFKYYKAHFDLKQKNNLFIFFMKFAHFEKRMFWYIL